MNQIYPDEGLLFLAKRLAGHSIAGLKWQLFENDITPTLATILTDYTLITWAPAVQLAAAAFTTAGIAANVGTIQAPNAQFTNGGASADVYGYVVMDDGGTMLVAAGRFTDAPVTVGTDCVMSVIPILGDFSEHTTTP